jgi:hypothetical protein
MRLLFLLGLLLTLIISTSLTQNEIGTIFTLTKVVITESTGPEPTPVITSVPAPEPTEPPITVFSSSEKQQTLFTSVGTAAPPSGGGATCAQQCLAQAAAQAGCGGL